jgi:hypothetical protein
MVATGVDVTTAVCRVESSMAGAWLEHGLLSSSQVLFLALLSPLRHAEHVKAQLSWHVLVPAAWARGYVVRRPCTFCPPHKILLYTHPLFNMQTVPFFLLCSVWRSAVC